ncbi:MAG: sigma-70 family RNA polymerase sigma factor [Planctomycetaceae bacterium]|nr:sigma-70 family RNA polymerase sigma factor [Planctomycetaceae bacterium]
MPLTDTDRKLLSELLAGRSNAWKVFVDRFTGLVLQVIQQTAQSHSIKLSEHDVEDLCADTYAELLSRDMASLRSFRGRCSFATYLAVIVRRIVVRQMTHYRYRQAMGHVNAHRAAIDLAGDSSDVRQLEARDEVESLMSSLPQEQQTLLSLHFLQHRSYREIATLLKKPLNSIGPMLSRLREAMQSQSPRPTR